MLVPPANFGIAEEGIYRCSKVETLNLSFIETLNLKTVIFIGGQEPSKFFQESFNEQTIKWYLIKMSDFSTAGKPIGSGNRGPGIDNQKHDNKRRYSHSRTSSMDSTKSAESYHLTDSDDLMLIKGSCIKKAFQLLLNKERHNILLVDRTSIIVGILRKIQRWNISSILNEYRLYSGKNSSYFAETFLEILQVIIKQEKEDDSILEDMDNLELGDNYDSLSKLNSHRKLSNSIFVQEDDLENPIEVPPRLLRIIDEAEKRKQLLSSANDSDPNSATMTRTSSSLGIFGNRYRLAFNGRERGLYNYYNSFNRNDMDDALTLQIPKESLLPEWLKFQRDLWETENYSQEHNFYKESIFI